MPRKPMKIAPAQPAVLKSSWEVAYVLARLEGIPPAEALERFRAEAWKRALEEADRRGVPPSQQLRSVVREVDQDVSKVLATEARRRGLFGTARRLRMLPRLGDIFETVDLEALAAQRAAASAAALQAPRGSRRPALDDSLREAYPDFSDDDLRAFLDDRYGPEQAASASTSALPSPALPSAAALVPAPRRRGKRERIVRLSRAALDRLITPTAPRPDDYLQAWLPEVLEARLRAHGVLTLHQLMVLVSRHPRWHEQIAGLGAGKARLIEGWLRAHELMPARGAGRAPPAPSPAPLGSSPCDALPVVASGTPETSVMAADEPLDAFARLALFQQPERSGLIGTHRAPQAHCMIDARTDLVAIGAWLATLRSDHTQRAYRREALRYALWLAEVRERAVSSASVDDANAYVALLQAVPASWSAVRTWPTERAAQQVIWQPFEGPLSKRSIAFAVTVLRRMYRWLADVRYMTGNPFTGISKGDKKGLNTMDTHRSLPADLVELVLERLCAPSEQLTAAASRRRLTAALLFDSGLRRHEAAKVTYGDIKIVRTAPKNPERQTRFELHFEGKGEAQRNVPVTPRVLRLMEEDLRVRDHLADVAAPENAALGIIGPLRATGASGITGQTVYRECLAALEQVAQELDGEGRELDARLLREATTHWARHSFAKRIAAHTTLDVVQELLGHADLRTTRIYATVDSDQRAAAVAAAGVGHADAAPADSINGAPPLSP